MSCRLSYSVAQWSRVEDGFGLDEERLMKVNIRFLADLTVAS